MSDLESQLGKRYSQSIYSALPPSDRPHVRQRTNVYNVLGQTATAGAYAVATTLKTIAESRFYGAAQEAVVDAMEVVAEQATDAAVPIAVAAVSIGKQMKIEAMAHDALPASTGSRYTRRAQSARNYKKAIRHAIRIK